MSFWKKIGGLAVKAGEAALQEGKEAMQRGQQYKAEMPQKSDDQLLKIIKNERGSSPLKAGAAMQELEARGYTKDEIKIRIS